MITRPDPRIEIEALELAKEIPVGCDLGGEIVSALKQKKIELTDGDLLVVAQKAISKAEGRVVALADVTPSAKALKLADGRDPRLVQVVLDQSRRLIRGEPVLIAETEHGFICANAGVDQSNCDQGFAVLLPEDPDLSASRLRCRLEELTAVANLGVVISDSFGRPWRVGQCDVAIGSSGIDPLDDWRGRDDSYGQKLNATVIATADQVAAAADLARSKDSLQPVVLIRGLRHTQKSDNEGSGAKALIRAEEHNLFQ